MLNRKLLRVFLAIIAVAIVYYSFLYISKQYNGMKRNIYVHFSERNLIYKLNQLKLVSEEQYSTAQIERAQIHYPNLPIRFLLDKKKNKGSLCHSSGKKKSISYNKGDIPSRFNISVHSQYWQEYKSINSHFYLYNAYLDNRKDHGYESKIRIISLLDMTGYYPFFRTKDYCLFWTDLSSNPTISTKPLKLDKIHPFTVLRDSEYYPYLLTCYVPKDIARKIPIAVSIVSGYEKKSKCYEPSNLLKVNAPLVKNKKDFAVCVKAYMMNGSQSAKLVEWIELLSILGARKIFLYDLDLDSDIKKLLDYYVKKGIVDLSKTSLPGVPVQAGNEKSEYLKKKLEVRRPDSGIHLNDCFYRNFQKYEYIANLDIDEVIVPRKKGHKWTDIIKYLRKKNKKVSSYIFPNTYFFDDLPILDPSIDKTIHEIPKTNHMLRHVYRSKRVHLGKCFIRTKDVKIAGSHFAQACINGGCERYGSNKQGLQYISESEVAYAAHYRSKCQDLWFSEKSCNEKFKKENVLDTTLWNFKDELISRTQEILSKMD